MTLHRTEERGTGRTGHDGLGDRGGGLLDDEVYASDPVCGMDVAVGDARFKAEVAGEVFYFCSQSCQSRFQRHPEKYT